MKDVTPLSPPRFPILRTRAMWCAAGAFFFLACSDDHAPHEQLTGSGGAGTGGGPFPTGGASGTGGQVAPGGQQGTGATGGSASGGATGGAGETTGGTLGSGGAETGTGGSGLSTGGADGGDTGGGDSGSGGDTTGGTGGATLDPGVASGFDALLLDRPCSQGTSLPLETGATCSHRETLRVEETFTFGGEPGTTYAVSLRVRGIWEPTSIAGGEQEDDDVPLMVGGDVAMGSGSDSDAINYQQFYVEVSSPAQTYWLNNHGYVAHDIHKEDYEATLLVEGGATVTVIANDGNERQIANFPQESFPDLPPYDQTPTLGQFLRLDVVGVELAP